MKNLTILVLVLLISGPVLADEADKQFALALEEALQQPRDPRTQARLARWNDDPMARVAMHMASEQARIYGGNLPGMGQPRALVLSVQLRKNLASALTIASSASGVTFYERRMAVITWPWEEDKEPKPSLPLDEQLTVMLGDRLENP
jgi:hypothetical protein